MAVGSVQTKQPGGMMEILAKRGAFNPIDQRFPYRLREGWRFWHRQAYPAAGQTSAFSFFNAQPTPFRTNMLNANQLPQNYWFEMRSIGIRIVAQSFVESP